RPAPVLASYQRYLEQNGLAPSPPAGDPEGRPLVAMAGSAAALLLATSLVFGAILAEPQPGAAQGIEAAAPFPAEQAVSPATTGGSGWGRWPARPRSGCSQPPWCRAPSPRTTSRARSRGVRRPPPPRRRAHWRPRRVATAIPRWILSPTVGWRWWTPRITFS